MAKKKADNEETRREMLWAWMNERQAIWVRRQHGDKPPWTKNPILRTYKFTNVFRELDAVTLALHQRVDRFAGLEAEEDRLFRIIAFRAFNVPETYDRITGPTGEFHSTAKMKTILHAAAKDGAQIFTGAYIITNAGSKRPKIDLVVEALAEAYKRRGMLWRRIEHDKTMRGATMILTSLPMMGMFTAYEVVCDLRWQRDMVLNRASDRDTWANLGPGARRGINRIITGKADKNAFKRGEDYIEYMRKLLEWAPMQMYKPNFEDMPKLEMREIEHSLCEFDKFMRVWTGEGRPRSKYHYEGKK